MSYAVYQKHSIRIVRSWKMRMRMLIFLEDIYEKNQISAALFFQSRDHFMVRLRDADRRFIRAFRQGELPYSRRLAGRGYRIDLCRKRKSRRTAADRRVQRSVRDYLIHVRVLRRNDNLSRNDRAHGCFLVPVVDP